MTAEELIIGHYEKTLTSEQETHLSAMVAASPDVRSLFEQHGNVHSMLVDEAATVKPSSKLDKVVVGAALGTLAEIAGQGIGFSLLGKAASLVGALAVGGIGFVLYDNYIDDDATKKSPTPAVVRENSNTTVVPIPVENTPTTIDENVTPTQPEVPAAASRSTPTPRSNASSPDARTTTRSGPTTSTRSRGIDLNASKPDATITDSAIKPRSPK